MDKRKTIAYIAHPVGGDLAMNKVKIKNIAREINLNEPDTVPFVPYFIDISAMDDKVKTERERGMENNDSLLRSGVVDELRLYGDRLTSGMIKEIHIARERKIVIKCMTKGTKAAWDSLFG